MWASIVSGIKLRVLAKRFFNREGAEGDNGIGKEGETILNPHFYFRRCRLCGKYLDVTFY
jgi:hypothetical protein